MAARTITGWTGLAGRRWLCRAIMVLFFFLGLRVRGHDSAVVVSLSSHCCGTACGARKAHAYTPSRSSCADGTGGHCTDDRRQPTRTDTGRCFRHRGGAHLFHLHRRGRACHYRHRCHARGYSDHDWKCGIVCSDRVWARIYSASHLDGLGCRPCDGADLHGGGYRSLFCWAVATRRT